MYAYPKHVCTDHPVLVYKTCKIEQTVLRLFSCLPPTTQPSQVIHLSQPFTSTCPLPQLPPHSKPSLLSLLVITVVSHDTIDDWRGSCERCAILFYLLIGKEKICMKHIVNLHQLRKRESHGHRTNLLCNFEGSISWSGHCVFQSFKFWSF